jgi:hypothetical protein
VAEANLEFATDYSLPPAHLITLIVPEFFGEPLRVGYWSVPTFEELTYYAGIVAVLGLILALRRPDRLTWFYVVLIVVGLWLALGRYGVLYELAFRWLPPFRLVRAPGRAAFLFLFAASALLAHALTIWREMPYEQRHRRLRVYWPAVVIIFAMALVAALAATGAVFMAVHPTDTSGRLWHQIGGYSLALLVVGLGGALIWTYLFNGEGKENPQISQITPLEERGEWSVDSGRWSVVRRPLSGNRSRLVAGAALILLVVADTWWFSFKMARLSPTAPDPVWTDGRALIAEPDGRVLPWGVPLFPQNGAIQVDWPSVFGYDSLEPAAHIALASSVPDPRSTAYDVLGAAYVLAGGPLDEFTEGERPLTLVGQNGSAWVYRRARPLPLARLVYRAEIIPDDAAAIARIHAADFDPATTATLPQAPPCDLGPLPDEAGTAEILEHEPTRWRIQTTGDAPGLLVLAENAYPGWRVTVDGQPAEPLTAYTSVRAVCVPAGEHLVEWSFMPRLYLAGGVVTLIVLLLLVAAVVLLWRSRTSTNDTDLASE